jgi:hypothetical protein
MNTEKLIKIFNKNKCSSIIFENIEVLDVFIELSQSNSDYYCLILLLNNKIYNQKHYYIYNNSLYKAEDFYFNKVINKLLHSNIKSEIELGLNLLLNE